MHRSIIIGGSSGMGKAAAKHVVSLGGEVLICSRRLVQAEFGHIALQNEHEIAQGICLSDSRYCDLCLPEVEF
jgi:NAD(P)-dependent dehydrogenase (short-subunit alcohol dehydrogenase family)